MYKKIIVPVSSRKSGERTRKALAHARALCKGELVLLHVTEPLPNLVGGEARMELKNDARAMGLTLLCPFLDELERAGIKFQTRVEEGNIAETIVRIAHEEEADLIVMFTDGRDNLEDMLFGSITERVLRETDTPLLAVRR